MGIRRNGAERRLAAVRLAAVGVGDAEAGVTIALGEAQLLVGEARARLAEARRCRDIAVGDALVGEGERPSMLDVQAAAGLGRSVVYRLRANALLRFEGAGPAPVSGGE